MQALLIDWAEQGRVPDLVVRWGIRRLLRGRLRELRLRHRTDPVEQLYALIDTLRQEPVAVETGRANEQHYEVPTEFFRHVLGRRMKYSACLWPEGTVSLDDAEDRMLELTCERAGLRDGQHVLELGCGWGALTLWMAERYPGSRITAVSNSVTQRETIEERAADVGLSNVTVLTKDMNTFEPGRRFDRVVSLEMFEHMRNLDALFQRVAGWLEADGRLFIHIFCRERYPYLFEARGHRDWMAQYFFTGGMMPSEDLMARLQRDLALERHWRVNGMHYARTLHAWLDKLDAAVDRVLPVLRGTYGDEAERWLMRWRMFFMACEELFAFKGGNEWFVGHYLYSRRV